jgi:hypothetical protein
MCYICLCDFQSTQKFKRLFILSLGSIKYIVSSFWENILLFILSYYPTIQDGASTGQIFRIRTLWEKTIIFFSSETRILIEVNFYTIFTQIVIEWSLIKFSLFCIEETSQFAASRIIIFFTNSGLCVTFVFVIFNPHRNSKDYSY